MPDYIIVNGELYHHGVKGMKWGVRRYQNADGSLTPAGKKRYSGPDGDVLQKKDNYKQAKREYSKSYDKAYNKAIAGYSPIKKHREANEQRWKDVHDKANAADAARKEYKDAKKSHAISAVKEYSKKFNAAEKASNAADREWKSVQEQYKSLGRNRVERMLKVAKGNTPEAKRYKKMYDAWERSENSADRKWAEAKKAYTDTGRFYAERIVNNIRYGN